MAPDEAKRVPDRLLTLLSIWEGKIPRPAGGFPYTGRVDWIRVGAEADFPEGRVKPVRVDRDDLAVCRVGGALHVLLDLCPHQNYPLSKGELRGAALKCDLHQWQFDVTTGLNLANPCNFVRRYPVKVEGGEVYVKLEPLPPPAAAAPPGFVSRDDA